jgi:hypothetical protein
MSEGELNKRQHIGDEAIFMADAFTEFPAIFFFLIGSMADGKQQATPR